MKYLVIFVWCSIPLAAIAGPPASTSVAAGTRVYETDGYGRIRHDRPSWVVTDKGRVVEVTPYGRRQPHKQQFAIKGDRIYAADSMGRVQHNKPSWTVRADGRVIQNDAFGHPQYHEQQYTVKGSMVYKTGPTGRSMQPAYAIQK